MSEFESTGGRYTVISLQEKIAMSPAALVLRVIVLIVVFIVVIALAAFALKLLFTLFAFAVVIAAAIFTFMIFKRLFKKRQGSDADTAFSTVLLQNASGSIQLFAKEPQVQDLVRKDKADLPAIAQVSVNSGVSAEVLDEGELSLKIKIKSGELRGKVGWVDKGSVSGYARKT